MTDEGVQSVYELETANVILRDIKGLDPAKICAVLVHSHGPFIWGQTGKDAAQCALALEIVAEIAIKTIHLDSNVKPVPLPLLDKHYERKHEGSAYYGQSIDSASNIYHIFRSRLNTKKIAVKFDAFEGSH
jgi:L-ribulose-5-phosphate 4-epimerase